MSLVRQVGRPVAGCRVWSAECGVLASFRASHSSVCIAHSPSRIPHSFYSALRTPHSAFVVAAALIVSVLLFPTLLAAQTAEDCLGCHSDKSLKTTRQGKSISAFVDQKRYAASIHGQLPCVGCHADLEKTEFPHKEKVAAVNCGACHADQQKQHGESLHGKAVARGDPLAPRCHDCHGNHDIGPARDPRSTVAPQRVPFVCGKCHQEGAPVQRQRQIHESHILENYSESIHGEALLKKGLVVTATCISCHTAHNIRRHTDAASSIARRNIAATCIRCHVRIEDVHRKVVKGELWEKEVNVLPACSVLSTRKPPTPSSIWRGIPPARLATTGVAFHIVSDTPRPNPSRIDFWITTSAEL